MQSGMVASRLLTHRPPEPLRRRDRIPARSKPIGRQNFEQCSQESLLPLERRLFGNAGRTKPLESGGAGKSFEGWIFLVSAPVEGDECGQRRASGAARRKPGRLEIEAQLFFACWSQDRFERRPGEKSRRVREDLDLRPEAEELRFTAERNPDTLVGQNPSPFEDPGRGESGLPSSLAGAKKHRSPVPFEKETRGMKSHSDRAIERAKNRRFEESPSNAPRVGQITFIDEDSKPSVIAIPFHDGISEATGEAGKGNVESCRIHA